MMKWKLICLNHRLLESSEWQPFFPSFASIDLDSSFRQPNLPINNESDHNSDVQGSESEDVQPPER